jgi:tRNA(Ile)-lysidine synthase
VSTDLPERVSLAIAEHRLLRPAQPLLVAVSGGLDSMVLLRVLHGLSERHGWRLAVAHLNHQLRGRSSLADEQLVRRAAKQLGLAAIVERAHIRQFARANGLSIEMAARKVRHDFLARTALQMQIPTVALAHHAEDQVELFFLRLLRGSGSDGLAGMKWSNPSPADPQIELVRPLLGETKAALRAHAAGCAIRFRDDATNAALDIQRNRIRNELLPLLRRKYQPALDKAVLRCIDLVSAEAQCVSMAAADWLARKDARRFDSLAIALQRRCVQMQLLQLGITAGFDLIEQLRMEANRPVCVAPEVAVFRDDQGIVRLRPPPIAAFSQESLLMDLSASAGTTVFGNVEVRWRMEPKRGLPPARRSPQTEFFDADKVGSAVTLRHWRPGDRFQPIGMERPVKLQDLFTNQKVPRARRGQLVLGATSTGEIFWVEGLRMSERFKLTKSSIRRLQWRWQRL